MGVGGNPRHLVIVPCTSSCPGSGNPHCRPGVKQGRQAENLITVGLVCVGDQSSQNKSESVKVVPTYLSIQRKILKTSPTLFTGPLGGRDGTWVGAEEDLWYLYGLEISF